MKHVIMGFLLFNVSVACCQNISDAMGRLKGKIAKEQKPGDKIVAMDYLATFYGYIGEPDSVRIICDEMLKLATSTREDSSLATAYLELGFYFSLTSDYKQALEYDFKALALAEASKNDYVIWFSNKEIGAFFKQLKNYPEALKYLNRSRFYLDGAVKQSRLSSNRTYSHLAEVFLGLGEIDSAMRYVQLTNEVTVKEEDSYGFGRMLYIFAKVYQAKGDADLSDSYFKKCITFCEAGNVNIPYVTACTGYGQFLFDAGQYSLSKEYALDGFNRASQAKDKLGMINAAALVSKAYYAVGQKDSSYYYASVKDAYSDTVFNEQQRYQIQNLSFSQQIKENEDQVKLSEEKQRRMQNIQYALIALGIIVFVTLFLLLSRSIIVNERLISFLAILGLLVVFEFINLLVHPWLAHLTNESPVLMLLALVIIASLLIPLHHRFEHRIKERLVEKNKAIRLAAAKRTIEKLEGRSGQ